MPRALIPFTLLLCLTTACDGDKADAKKADAKKADAKGDAKADTKADAKAEEAGGDEGAAEPEPEAEEPKAGPNDPSNDKEFLGLELTEMGDWKPVWDADAKVAKWENDEFMSGIVIRVVDDKLESIDDLKAAAPMMMQVGTAISNVDEDLTKTEKGWWTVVSYNDGKSQVLLYVREFGTSTTVCSAALKSSMGEGIKKDDAMKACESYELAAS